MSAKILPSNIAYFLITLATDKKQIRVLNSSNYFYDFLNSKILGSLLPE